MTSQFEHSRLCCYLESPEQHWFSWFVFCRVEMFRLMSEDLPRECELRRFRTQLQGRHMLDPREGHRSEHELRLERWQPEHTEEQMWRASSRWVRECSGTHSHTKIVFQFFSYRNDVYRFSMTTMSNDQAVHYLCMMPQTITKIQLHDSIVMALP